jgi:tetratricopeptide (TPR) repeat protein
MRPFASGQPPRYNPFIDSLAFMEWVEMPRVVIISAVLAAVSAATTAVSATEPPPVNQASTIVGPTNPQLADGATALDEGRIEDGIRLTLEGLRYPAETRDRAAGYSNLCAGYAMLKQWDEALQNCNTSLAMDRNNWRTFNNRAAIYVARGQYESALADLRAGLEIAPNSRTLLESLRIVQQNKRLYSVRSRSSVRSP